MKIQTARLVIVAACILQTFSAFGQGRGEGAIVVREKVTIYTSATGLEEKSKDVPRGFAVGGITTTAMAGTTAYELQEENGRLHVIYVDLDDSGSGEQKSIYRLGWVARSDVSNFTYECGCTSAMDRNKCYPLTQAGFVTLKYNACFKEGMNKKLLELRAAWEQKSDLPSSTATLKSSTEKALTNDDLVALAGAGLGDEIVISKIQQSPNEMLDVSVEALIKLKAIGFSKVVLESMVKRAGQRK